MWTQREVFVIFTFLFINNLYKGLYTIVIALIDTFPLSLIELQRLVC